MSAWLNNYVTLQLSRARSSLTTLLAYIRKHPAKAFMYAYPIVGTCVFLVSFVVSFAGMV